MNLLHMYMLDPTPAPEKPGSRASGDKSSGAPGGGGSPTPHTLVAVPKKDDDLDGRYEGFNEK